MCFGNSLSLEQKGRNKIQNKNESQQNKVSILVTEGNTRRHFNSILHLLT